MKTVIMAGGRGTRIAPVAEHIPKPMIKIGEMPILEREIACLREQGFSDIILTVGYLADVIIDYFGDGSKISPVTGKAFGVYIRYYIEKEPLGNAGALFKIKDELTEDFLLLNGDIVFDIDFKRFVAYHKEHGGLATLFTHPNSHPYDSGLIISHEKNKVVKWLNREDERQGYYKNRVNAGLHVISPKLLEEADITTERIDLDRQLLKPLAGTGKMYVYDSPEYVKDMGTPERYERVCHDFQNGLVHTRNLRNRQKAIFMDRDGTINKYVGFLRNIEKFELLPGVEAAIKKINMEGYLAIVVSNQPVVARGEVAVEELQEIHNKMETMLGEQGAYLDGIYYCPHHPEKGFEGEIPELKTVCSCRKPKPGMLLKASHDYNIDLTQSWMIGDSRSDIEAGQRAGCKTILISQTEKNFGQNWICKSLYYAVDLIFRLI